MRGGKGAGEGKERMACETTLDTVPPPQRLSYHIDLIGVKEPDRFLRITKEPHTSTVILYIAAKIVHVAQSGHYHRHYMSGLDWGHTAETGSQRFLKAVLVTGHSIYRTRLIGSRNIYLATSYSK